MLRIELDAAALKPLIALIVQETLDQLESDRAKVGDKQLALEEAAAAASIGVARHVLRDARLRGEIAASRIGKRAVYSRKDLIEFLAARRGQD
jgi:hypothetical protein